jgi:capsular polysaccharide biosynthesis protein
MDPNDPVFVLATISELMLADAKAEFQRILTTAMDQASAANVQAEAAARAKAEAIVTKAGEWAAERIKDAGDQAAARIQTEAQKAHEDTAVVTRKVQMAMAAAVVCAVAALAESVSTVVAIWVG